MRPLGPVPGMWRPPGSQLTHKHTLIFTGACIRTFMFASFGCALCRSKQDTSHPFRGVAAEETRQRSESI